MCWGIASSPLSLITVLSLRISTPILQRRKLKFREGSKQPKGTQLGRIRAKLDPNLLVVKPHFNYHLEQWPPTSKI